jgi:hypothetical protein
MGLWGQRENVRVLVDEAGAVVDLVVDDNVEVLLGSVFRDIGVGEFLVGHGVCGRGRGRGGVGLWWLCRDKTRQDKKRER